MPLTYTKAIRALWAEFNWNQWFVDTYWPEDEPRVRPMVNIAQQDNSSYGRVLEVGCANGYRDRYSRY